jgi:hypothetical protein
MSSGGLVMVPVCGVVDVDVSTGHVIKLLRVGLIDFGFFLLLSSFT